MTRMICAVACALCAAACAGCGRDAAPARAASTRERLAPVTDATQMSAYRGRVVWSQRAGAGRWRLVEYHGGAVRRVPIAARSVPFDVDMGPGTGGEPVAVYSRCQVEPSQSTGLNGRQPDWWTGSGCDIYAYDFRTRRENRLAQLSAAGASQTNPSIWRGDVAFARREPQAPKVKLLLWHHARQRISSLAGGPRRGCYQGETPGTTCHAQVQGLDLGERLVAYVWQDIPGEDLVPDGVGELRVASRAAGRSRSILTGFISGACGARVASSPQVTGARLEYLDLINDCDNRGGGTHTLFRRLDTRTRRRTRVEPRPVRYPRGEAYALARDGDDIYWIYGPNEGENSADAYPDFCGVKGCSLMRSHHLHFSRPQPNDPKPT